MVNCWPLIVSFISHSLFILSLKKAVRRFSLLGGGSNRTKLIAYINSKEQNLFFTFKLQIHILHIRCDIVKSVSIVKSYSENKEWLSSDRGHR